MILTRGYKILKIAEGGIMLILDLKKEGLIEKNSLKAVLINN
jgi:hypothetical protein